MRFHQTKPVMIPLTPVVVAAFVTARQNPVMLPPVALHAVYAYMAAVFVVGTYLMTFRDLQSRSDMAKALSIHTLLPVDICTHWVPAAVVLYDLATDYACPKVGLADAAAVVAFTSLAAFAYLRYNDTEYMYQISNATLVSAFFAVSACFFFGTSK